MAARRDRVPGTPRWVLGNRGVLAFFRSVLLGLTFWLVVALAAAYVVFRELEWGGVLTKTEATVGFFVAMGVMFPASVFLAARRMTPLLVERLHELERLRGVERETLERLRELDRIRTTFLAGTSHELRRPLTTLSAAAVTLEARSQHLPEERRRELEVTVSRAAARLRELLDQLLDLDRLSHDSIQAFRRPVNVRELVEKLARDTEAPVELDVQVGTAAIDVVLVERIIENLLDNAAKYAPDSLLRISVVPDESDIVIAVADRGPGVPDEHHETIFDRGVRGPAASLSPGRGVGLDLVREFARLHGGEAWVENRPGGGAEFRVRLADAEPRATER